MTYTLPDGTTTTDRAAHERAWRELAATCSAAIALRIAALWRVVEAAEPKARCHFEESCPPDDPCAGCRLRAALDALDALEKEGG